MKFFFFLLSLLISSCFFACNSRTAREEAILQTISDTIVAVPELKQSIKIDALSLDRFYEWNKVSFDDSINLESFYKRRSMQFAWFSATGPNEQASTFINLLYSLGGEGLGTDSTAILDGMQHTLAAFADSSISLTGNDSLLYDTEIRLTLTFFRYASRVWEGISPSKSRELEWFIQRKPLDLASSLDAFLDDSLHNNIPIFRQYSLLKPFLMKYRQFVASGEWKQIPWPGKTFVRGDSAPEIAEIKQRLFVLGDLQESDSGMVYNAVLDSAVKSFRERHGKSVKGGADSWFYSAINFDPATRVKQIMINMERCRWVPVQTDSMYLAVNIPEYKLHMYKEAQYDGNMNVVVGKEATQTVIFNGELKTIVFSPYWNVPASIIHKEILPGLRKDPGYLRKHNMEAILASEPSKPINPANVKWSKYTGYNLPYIIRQKPGPNNALGKVKFLFPNSHSIYLHDTPSKSLFSNDKRSYSHGCIRLSDPLGLAMFLLKDDPAWNKEKILKAMNSGKEQYVKIRKPVPVFIAYFTVWVDSMGRLNFREDIYGHDKRMNQFLYAS